jgi:S-adenosylhomocysteine hydrolase
VIGLRSSFDSMHSGRSPNDSEVSDTPLKSGQQSVTSHENIRVLSSNDSSTQNHSAVPVSKITTRGLVQKTSFHSQYTSERPSDIRQYKSISSNAIIDHQSSLTSKKHRRYRITVLHTDESLDIPSSQCTTTTEVIFSVSLTTNVVYLI